MKNFQQNVTHRFNNLASVRSCPSHEANNASELVSAAVSRSSKTKKDATNVNQSVSDVHREVLRVEDAVKDLQTVQTSKSLQRKIQLYNDSFDRLREILTQVRNARDEQTTFIEKLRAKVRALKSEVTDLEGLRDSLRDIPPCGVA